MIRYAVSILKQFISAAVAAIPYAVTAVNVIFSIAELASYDWIEEMINNLYIVASRLLRTGVLEVIDLIIGTSNLLIFRPILIK